MTDRNHTTTVDLLHPICAGLDIHRAKISACIAVTQSNGKVEYIIKEFGAATYQLIKLREWLTEHNCQIAAMESTGIFWRPVHNILENHVNVILVNARHIKNVPGRKTDIEDSRWLASLLRIGLVKGSFIPDKDVRQWRDLVTLRKSYVDSQGDYKRRVHKLFETANIKISTVVTDIFGATGRNLIDLLMNPTAEINDKTIAACARGSLKNKINELTESIRGFFEDHHRFQLKLLMDMIDKIEKDVSAITQRLDELMNPHETLIARLTECPGIEKTAAQSILSYIGYSLKEFPEITNFVSWAGLCPGNNESAGKRKSGKSPVRNHAFKTVMVEIAWSAIKKKGSYYKEKYHRLKLRRGPKKAIVAIAHRIAKAVYHIIKYGDSFKDLGEEYLLVSSKNRKIDNLKKQAALLGFTLTSVAD